MPELQIAMGAYQRTGDPTLAARNCYAEQVAGPSGPRIEMRARPGLELLVQVGPGPLRGIAQKDGLFGGAAILVSGDQVWSLTGDGVATMLTGSIDGNGRVDIDLGQNSDLASVARIATQVSLFTVVSGGSTRDVFPDSGDDGASSTCFHRGFWFATATDTQQAFDQVPGDATWVPLSFASAEYAPDPLVAIRSRGDQFALLGSSTFEPWTLTGQADPAIAPYGGLNGDFGCRSRDAAVNCKGSLIWVDNECNVRRWDGGTADIVSGPGLSEIIRQVDAADLRAWTFAVDSHRFYVLTVGSVATWVYDLNGPAERWTTFDSLNNDYWLAHLGTAIGDVTVALDAVSNQVYRLAPDRNTDGDTEFATEFTAMVDGQPGSAPLSNVVVVCDMGDAPLTGQGSVPVIQMQISVNQGKTFGPWIEQPLGVSGAYDNAPRWNGLGQVPAFFGMILRFRISDPVRRVFKRVFANVP